MPMFQEPFEPRGAVKVKKEEKEAVDLRLGGAAPAQRLADLPRDMRRRVSEESIRTDLCEGPIPDSPPALKSPTPPEKPPSNAVSDRAELIERLKKGESPTWIPNRHSETASPPRTPHRPNSASPVLLPPPTITPEKADRCVDDSAADLLQEGLNIERPRSALHSGDFTPDESPSRSRDGREGTADEPGSFRAPAPPWPGMSPPRDYQPFTFGRATGDYRREVFNPSGTSSLSSSFSSSFIYKPPTSPLVQSESNDDLDLSLPLNSINIASSSPRSSSRRHTMSFNFSQSSPYGNISGQRQGPPRREGSYPYQAHQPRRSLASTPSFSLVDSSPQTPFFRSRRPSLGADVSPLQHASMVGSYEESILRGRMSTTPSKPLDFMAQIGVLGLGNCKSSLRCPAHVTLPFSAVFYSYASTLHGRSKTEDGPSPYVGQIDLENGLAAPDEGQRATRKLQAARLERGDDDDDVLMKDTPTEVPEDDARTSAKRKRRSRSPKPPPPGGRYRIPEKGQLQIIIKNQNKTAVKLFLVPYDLAGMEPGTKTFIRQRSYSAGPIMDPPPPATATAPDAGDRPILRYLIHLHICCPSKGRFYLYKSVRVVFANRVPDGKERLRNEITHPEPRFTPYKPVRAMLHPQPSSYGPAATLAAEKAFRRRSAGFSFTQQQQHQAFPAPPPPPLPETAASSSSPFAPLPAPSSLAAVPPPPPPAGTMTSTPRLEVTRGRYDKLSKGDVGYGGNAFVPIAASPGANAEGLLSKRLRSLGVQGGGSVVSEGGVRDAAGGGVGSGEDTGDFV
ncbi:hypothetical protein B0T18DRAFT_155967 [Schizothecium vesticola]|uniref:Atos-like conserved domain-containing protein n=1 Tax=Schizothecium vesticola TaxID=314040 RepID=A0AA40EW67_9PEZI|nr:hypothetical protein B0T18DRAFT_155967 [Schizothecium vesticola]